MSIEKSKSSSIDGQWIRDNESKEFEYGYSRSDDAKTAYQIIVERLALNKIKNELLFNGMLDAQLRTFASDGITISREQLIDDINKEVARQQVNYDLDSGIALNVQQPQVQSDIDTLKNNLGSLFESAPTQSQQPVNQSTTIPREPAIESTKVKDVLESTVQNPIHSEQDFDEVYDFEIKKLAELKKGNNPNYEVELSNTIRKISSLSDKISDVRGQIESDIKYELSISSKEQIPNQVQQSKDTLINEIIKRMADAGEFSYIPLEDISQRVDAMNMVKRRLHEKSIDELEIIFNSYVNQYEKTEPSGMHR